MKKTTLKGLTLAELEEFAACIGEQRYRGRQLFDWLYNKEANSFTEMSTISKNLRAKLETTAAIGSLTLLKRQDSDADGTTKFLFELHDGKRIESVLIPPSTAFQDASSGKEDEQKRLTLCVSTQAGCPLDCVFCATASMGFLRNLTSGEIVDQLMQAKQCSARRITNLVYMGMGEPLMNYDNVMKSVEIITTGMRIAARRITISTAGWVPGIVRMAEERRKTKLAVSLHTLDDGARSELMPINRTYPLARLLGAIDDYYRKTRLRVTFEYILFNGWNDTDADAERLIRLARRIPCKVNILPFHTIASANPVGLGSRLSPTPPARIDTFVRRLRDGHVTAFLRSSAGEDIDAACGQLAVRHEAGRRNTIIHNLQSA